MHLHNPPHPGRILRQWLAEITVTEAAARRGAGRHSDRVVPVVLNERARVSPEVRRIVVQREPSTPRV